MHILSPERLDKRNCLALPASATAFAQASSDREVHEALSWARERGLPILVLGEGSNIVFAGDVQAMVLSISTRGVEVLEEGSDDTLLQVAAGENWHRLVDQTLSRGLYGLENLALIPGTVGAAPIQNIGAYGVELVQCIERVHAIEIASGESISLAPSECGFGYRDSIFKTELRDRVLISAVDLRLSKQPRVNISYPALEKHLAMAGLNRPAPRDVFNAVVELRRSKLPDPAVEPNVGSFFKNPVVPQELVTRLLTLEPGMPHFPLAGGKVKVPAAWLIDQCGWKGHREGGVGVHPLHALVLVHYGGADGGQVLALADRIAISVKRRFGIDLDIEPRIYGDERG